jgi:hypothetical protein
LAVYVAPIGHFRKYQNDDDLIAAAERRWIQIAAMIEGLETLKAELLIEARELLAELDQLSIQPVI